jgi:CMP-N,N'-diacetyllegionaminic acid synthase
MIKKSKIIAMIPARIGSKRIPKKNLRLIDGKPLIAYIIETVLQTKIFDKIVLNADDIIFEKIANSYDIDFYYRKKELANDTATNDEFAFDFMNNHKGDILIQILPTSPLITSKEIEAFTKYMLENKVETLISVEHKQIASVYKNNPINFEKLKKNPPSQTMEPIKAYATVLMGWEYTRFKANIKKYNSAYHGGDGSIEYFELKGLSTIDIDNEEDFLLAEAIILSKKNHKKQEAEYYE